MKEIHTSGNKEFVYVMLWALALLAIGRGIINALPAYKIIGTIITILMYCVLGFYTLTRFCARFTYENTGYSLRINRMIGKRNKEIEFNFSDIISISSKRPADMPKPVYMMRTSIFSDRKSEFIIYGYTGARKTLVFEPTDKFMQELKRSIKKSKKEV